MSSSLRTRRKPRLARKKTSRSGPSRSSAYRARASARDKVDSDALRVTFWGVRGSIPSPGPSTRRYGGNTPCVEMRCGDELLLFDLGSGVRQFGEKALKEPGPVRATIFLSHYHYDHLQGLPFFTPIFDPNNSFVLYGAKRNGLSVKEILTGQMVQPYFPVTAEMVFRAQLDYRDFDAGATVTLGDATVTSIELNHPGGTLGYRINYKGKSVVYATDMEHGSAVDGKLAEFAHGADLLIYDAMYTEDEYAGKVGPVRQGWGHSTWNAAVRAAQRSGAKTLVLFHHEPTRDDAEMERILRAVRKLRPEAIAARENQTIMVR